MDMLRATTLALALLQGALPSSEAWERAAREIRRLPPAAFQELPAALVKQLEARGCTIPQTFVAAQAHNVIRGEFARPGQKDWAVLCSKGGKSTILVFWEKPTGCAVELALREDKGLLQTIGGGRIAYSRKIDPVDKDYILKHYQAYGGPEPPPLDHQGIDDAFVEKASVVHYCYQGKWLQLQGAD